MFSKNIIMIVQSFLKTIVLFKTALRKFSLSVVIDSSPVSECVCCTVVIEQTMG